MKNNKNQLTNWLYNQFVINHRKYGKQARIYWLILSEYAKILEKYAKIGFPDSDIEQQRQYAEKLLGILDNAAVDFKTHLLIQRGEAGNQDYKEQMNRYETRLRTIGYQEDEIKELITKRKKLNYGND